MTYGGTSRLLRASAIIALLYAVALAVGATWLSVTGHRTAFAGVMIGAAAIALIATVVSLVRSIVMVVRAPDQPPRFMVAADAFVVPPAGEVRWVVVVMLLQDAPVMGLLGKSATQVPLLWFALLLTVAFMTGALAFLWWLGSGAILRLTPSGVDWDAKVFRRHIPWEALAPGGPPRPSRYAMTIHLVVTRPELAVQRGWAFGSGTPAAPRLQARLRIHSAFLTDAIRWYADHPSDRAAIGSAAEHERLLSALGVAPLMR